MTEQEIEDGKVIAVVSYLSIIGTVVAYYMNVDKKNAFGSFHIRQALGLWLTFFAIGLVISSLDFIFVRFAFYMFFGVLFIYGFINALVGKPQTVPILGELYQKWFSSIGR